MVKLAHESRGMEEGQGETLTARFGLSCGLKLLEHPKQGWALVKVTDRPFHTPLDEEIKSRTALSKSNQRGIWSHRASVTQQQPARRQDSGSSSREWLRLKATGQ